MQGLYIYNFRTQRHRAPKQTKMPTVLRTYSDITQHICSKNIRVSSKALLSKALERHMGPEVGEV